MTPNEYLRGLLPVGHLHPLRASLGAMAGILLTGIISNIWLGSANGLPLLIASMGASAVLVFAVPASPLAQPWPLIGGSVISALAGIACARILPDPLNAAAMAVAVAIMAMSLCRCLHPPGGAVALTAVLGGPAITAGGWSFALIPVGLNAVILLAIAWAFNNATGHSYPHRATTAPHNRHGTADPPPQDRVGYTAADIDAVLARYDEVLDVSREDLDALFRQVEARAHRRLHAEIRCRDIMSRGVIAASPAEGIGQARDRLLAHDLAAMPVTDESGRLLGLIGHSQLLAGAGRHVRDVMDGNPLIAAPDMAIDELLPALSSGLHHDAFVISSDGTLLGMITQTDLLAALWRGHVAAGVAGNNEEAVPEAA